LEIHARRDSSGEKVRVLRAGPAKKVTVHLNEDTSAGSNFIYEQVFSFLFSAGVSGATLTRPQQGFGEHHHLHSTEGHGAEKRHLPVQIQFIESPDKVDALLPRLCDLVTDGLVEMQETTVLKVAMQETSF
jgi:PII-like signaling protein